MPRVYTSRLKRLGLAGALADLYETYVIRRGLDECWDWRGARSYGYGQMNLWGGPQTKAHIYAYERAHGPVPDGFDVMHLCHNPPCSNPTHLKAGTRSENQRMSRMAGRWPSKIPFEALSAIRARRRAGAPLAVIGHEYGCTKQAVRMFLKTWGA